MATVSGYKRCGCKDADGRQLGGKCGKLRRANGSWSPGHGTWYGKADIPAGPHGTRQSLTQGGFRTEGDMQEWFTAALALLAIPDPGAGGHDDRAAILALIKAARRAREPLPGYDEVRRRYQHGASFAAGTTGEYLTAWLEGHRRARDIKANTIRTYDGHIRKYLLPALGPVQLDRLRVRHIDAMYAGIDAENARIVAARASDDPSVRASVAGKRTVGPVTKERIRGTLRAALAAAMKGESPMLTLNVARLASLEPGTAAKARVWTRAREAAWRAAYDALVADGHMTQRDRFEAWRAMSMRPSPVMVWRLDHIGAFLDAIQGDRLYALYHLIAFRGLRRSEACGLRWAATDLEAAQITIETGIVTHGSTTEESRPKSEASDATVSLDRDTVAHLRAWRKVQAAEQLAWGGTWTDSGRVFTAEDGTGLTPARITTVFLWAAFRAGLPPIRLHDLRHGAASIAKAAGRDLKDIQRLLRHATYAITADLYTEVFDEVDLETAEAMAAIVPRRGRPSGTGGLTTVSSAAGDS